ncbi:hypothetical protein [Geminocystis sp. NIES-3709]|uniref:hypothetical protein n=1 Tax=Geminocystis sp. NIES-3709 TaxID=1617448 RepID=UPI0005FC7CD4|nr:hypothetical protein [Geminocystis sp. NIES-3709]BAQ67079.1 hypothetical protein GM3709_3844 [Geminocystis sp. NIES-3709]
MILPSLALRNSYGIDSFQRAIVFSALLLRYGYSFSDDRLIKDAVQLSLAIAGSGDRFTQFVNLRVGLQVSNTALNSGANLLTNIIERFGGSVDWTADDAEPSIGDFLPITAEPSGLTLEQYFYWACQQLLADDVENYKRVQITPTFKGITDTVTIDCTVSIPFNYTTYLQTNNLISAIGATEEEEEVGFGDETQLNDNLQLTD